MSSRLMPKGFIYLLIAVALIAIVFTLFSDIDGNSEIPINEVADLANHSQIESIQVSGERLKVTTTAGETFVSRLEDDATLTNTLKYLIFFLFY